LTLQAAGFAAAAILLCTHAPRWMFAAAFGVHPAGDLLFLSSKGRIYLMALNIEKYVKLAPWLQFVGVMLAFGGLLALSHWYGKPLAYAGLGVNMAGFVYDRIYP